MREDIQRTLNQCDSKRLNLQNMQLSDSEIGEIMPDIIKAFPTLEVIDLSHNQITDQGAIQIATYATRLSKLLFLDLQFNRIDATGIRALFALKYNNPFSDLTIGLHHNVIQDQGVIADIESEFTRKRSHSL